MIRIQLAQVHRNLEGETDFTANLHVLNELNSLSLATTDYWSSRFRWTESTRQIAWLWHFNDTTIHDSHLPHPILPARDHYARRQSIHKTTRVDELVYEMHLRNNCSTNRAGRSE